MPVVASRPTERVIDVLELLARRGSEPPRLSDLVRDLGLTQATAHAIMTSLCARRWAVRNPLDRSFTLGPAFKVAAAQSGADRGLLTAAHTAVRYLASDLGYPASVTERVGESLVITTLEYGGKEAFDIAAGDRLPFAAPLGSVFVAWDVDEARRAWMERGAVTHGALADGLEQLLAATRDRGYSVESVSQAMGRAVKLMTTLHGEPLTEATRRAIDGLLVEMTTNSLHSGPQNGADEQMVSAISAPIFDPQSEGVAFSVSIHPLRALSSRAIEELAHRVAAAAATINATTGSHACASDA
ncbi:helix-turn-helix domain-containing protein [Mycolicibacterium setense]|nr:helix-turn-helix domain-containing protein [Mycolicibacterium setense]